MKILTLILLICSITCHLRADNLSNLNGGFKNQDTISKMFYARLHRHGLVRYFTRAV